MFWNSKVIVIIVVIIGLFGMIFGMLNMVFLMLVLMLGWFVWKMLEKEKCIVEMLVKVVLF